jgi:putative tricarboxylic transport membrane protein
METLHALQGGFVQALTLSNLMWAAVGVTLGTAVGVLPGIGPALTIAVLLPVTFNLNPISAFIMFGGIYYGAMYGGSTTSILLNTPGETGAIATAIDGHQMARQGRGAAVALRWRRSPSALVRPSTSGSRCSRSAPSHRCSARR